MAREITSSFSMDEFTLCVERFESKTRRSSIVDTIGKVQLRWGLGSSEEVWNG